jgi:hypothetical protein
VERGVPEAGGCTVTVNTDALTTLAPYTACDIESIRLENGVSMETLTIGLPYTISGTAVSFTVDEYSKPSALGNLTRVKGAWQPCDTLKISP